MELVLAGGVVSSNPNVPAEVVSSVTDGVQDLNDVYRKFKSKFVDPSSPVVQSVGDEPPSELAGSLPRPVIHEDGNVYKWDPESGKWRLIASVGQSGDRESLQICETCGKKENK
ncbi:hypothetical protein SAMN05421810_10371 [Amycolatopsis arida]|uniref:Uncharacterized protein n=1 Tax=Amycolatopsis arida TaxID=587909 RepID=A0A1I5SAB5_9PSEU|nr:hypothetical protein [Amycolatopsis arida]TDX96544.1 hypothetical protein CLV69_103687 [Amycolatopsis arida]SFP67704.1 hypothetical protein SAMN05421810_10371 [Amycolatopsis arida]